MFALMRRSSAPAYRTLTSLSAPRTKTFAVAQTRPPPAFTFKDFQEMTKFKLSLANTLVALPLFVQCGAAAVTVPQVLAFGVATQLMAMSTQTANQAIEAEYDKLMMRTCRRPLPLQKIERKHAKMIAFGLFGASNAIFCSTFPLAAAGVANAIFFMYVSWYTPMKRSNIYNTALGAIVGALPPYLGWAAAGGSLLALPPLIQFAYMFSWQFSHFYGILYRYRTDYEAAGFKMQYDYREAVKHMKWSVGVSAASMLGLCHYGLNFITHASAGASAVQPIATLACLDALMLVALYQWAWLPLKHFDAEKGSVAAARSLKINSYKHFTLFWVLIYIDIALSMIFKKEDDDDDDDKNDAKKARDGVAVATDSTRPAPFALDEEKSVNARTTVAEK